MDWVVVVIPSFLDEYVLFNWDRQGEGDIGSFMAASAEKDLRVHWTPGFPGLVP